MPIDRITSAQYVDKLRTALLSRTRKYDTGYGPILDVVINPVATVLEDQNNNRLRKVSLLLSLQNESEFSEADLDATVFNEDLVRPNGSNATTILTFRREKAFSSVESGRIARGTPIGTASDEASGRAVTFVTSETLDKTSAVAVLDTDTNQTVYELQVPAVCLVKGSAGRVGADRVTRPLRPLVGWDSVTNKEPTQEGRDTYTNTELIELFLLAVSSRQLSVPTGAEFYVRDNFPSVEDVHEVYGTDPLLTRSASDAGAVDAFVIGESLLTRTDQLPFLGVGQLMLLSSPPVVRVDTVIRVSDAHVYEEGTDYVVALDSSGVSGSTRARDGIRFLPTVSPMPDGGAVISITYAYNQLVRDLQADAADPEVSVSGRDLLFRLGTRVDIYLTAQLKVLSGFKASDIQLAVSTAVKDFVNALKLGQDVEAFDVKTTVGRISGVDNFIITKLTRDAAAAGTEDVPIVGSEYARLDSINLIVTLI